MFSFFNEINVSLLVTLVAIWAVAFTTMLLTRHKLVVLAMNSVKFRAIAAVCAVIPWVVFALLDWKTTLVAFIITGSLESIVTLIRRKTIEAEIAHEFETIQQR